MARTQYGHVTERLAVREMHTVKVKIDRQRRRESDEDTREAFRRSATEFLRESQ